MENNQKGTALVISLILLVLMTIIGLSAMRSGVIEQKMAVNLRDNELAFQASETMLRDTENWLFSQIQEPLPTNDGSSQVWQFNIMDPNTANAESWWQELGDAWWNANALTYGIALQNINTAPDSIIEYQFFKSDDLVIGDGGSPSGTVYYRITSRGTGGSDNAVVLLQSTFARRN